MFFDPANIHTAPLQSPAMKQKNCAIKRGKREKPQRGKLFCTVLHAKTLKC
jgi:hypothetical protein